MPRTIRASELLDSPTFDPDCELETCELEKLYWRYKGLELELARERTFFAATNEALARAYEQLEERKTELELARAKLEDNNNTLERRVAEGIAKLREAERMAAYGQLVAGIVHEVRQPLFAIKTTAYLIADALRAHGDAQHLAILRGETARLEALFDELLDFAKPLALVRARVEVAPLLREAVASFQAQAPTCRLATEIFADGDPVASLDRMRVMQVLLNLLHNASKHAAGATRVELGARDAGDRVEITVENDGAPIHRDVVTRAFEPFFTTGRGAGLGLAIARRIVEAHRGAIEILPLAAGTRFTLALPARAAE